MKKIAIIKFESLGLKTHPIVILLSSITLSRTFINAVFVVVVFIEISFRAVFHFDKSICETCCFKTVRNKILVVINLSRYVLTELQAEQFEVLEHDGEDVHIFTIIVLANINTVQQDFSYLLDHYSNGGVDQSLFMKLVEEIGEVAEVLNKKAGRKFSGDEDLQAQLGNELADVIHYAVAIAALNGLDMNEVIIEKDKVASVKYNNRTNLEQFVVDKRNRDLKN